MAHPNTAAAKPEWQAELELDRLALIEATSALRALVGTLQPAMRVRMAQAPYAQIPRHAIQTKRAALAPKS